MQPRMTELLNWVNKRLGILLSVSGAGGNCSSPVVQEQDGKDGGAVPNLATHPEYSLSSTGCTYDQDT
jgi:hypothetical protein